MFFFLFSDASRDDEVSSTTNIGEGEGEGVGGGLSWKEKTPLLSILWKCHYVIVYCFCLQEVGEEGADEEVGWVGKGQLVCCEHCASVIV
jgi:hypothetical protein